MASSGDLLADWIGSEIRFPDGAPFVVHPWEREFLRGFAGEDESAISVARGNGKTTLCSAVAAAALLPDAPLHRPASQILLSASSIAQARIIYQTLLGFFGDLFDGRDWRIRRGPNDMSITHMPSAVELRVLSSDADRAHGIQPNLILADEPDKWPGPDGNKLLYNALKTSLGKIEDAHMVCLGTKSASPLKWWHSYLTAEIPFLFRVVHAADEDDDPFAEETWKKANPSYEYFPALRKRIAKEAAMAQLDPSALRDFKAYRLNLGTSELELNLVVSPGMWIDLVEAESLPERGGLCIWGLDMGGNKAMTACSAYWPQTGRLEGLAAFPGVPDLVARGKRDGVSDLYQRYHDEGSVVICGKGRMVLPIPEFLDECFKRFGKPDVMIGDPFRWAEIQQWLNDRQHSASILPRQNLNDLMAEDMRAFREACFDGKVSAHRRRLFRASLAMARTRLDAMGREVLAAKAEGGRAKTSRDDIVAAMIQAVAEGTRRYGRVMVA